MYIRYVVKGGAWQHATALMHNSFTAKATQSQSCGAYVKHLAAAEKTILEEIVFSKASLHANFFFFLKK